MKTKLLAILATSLISVTALTGCNKQQDDPSKLTIAVVGDTTERNIIVNFIRGYKAIPGNENKKISTIAIDNYDNYIFNTMADPNGKLADIIQVFDSTCTYYARGNIDGAGHGILRPITSYMQRDGINEADYVDSSIELTKCKVQGQANDQMYWVPRDYNKVVVAYNKNMFEAAGITERPSDNWTWTDFVNVCQTLKDHKDDITTSSVFYPVDMNLNFQAVFYPELESYGGKLITDDGRHCFNDIEIAKSSWNKLLQMVVDGLAAPADGKLPFASKQAAMMFIVRPDLPSYASSIGNNNIDFISLPSLNDLGEGATSYIGMGATGYGMTTHCPKAKREFAWDFLKYIISVDGQNVFSKLGSGVPCLKSLLNDENAEFRKYLSPALNHDAFVKFPERDLYAASYLNNLTPNKQAGVYKVVTDHALHDFLKVTESGYAIKNEYYARFKEFIEAQL